MLTTQAGLPLSPAFVIMGTAVTGIVAAWGLPDSRRIRLEPVDSSIRQQREAAATG
ncbi:hypothetical protein GCM10009850_102930 [Nonomuraea monospora]|uniref:Uncharacterized protein n=1 Tax=Nonomuraea monospora TaxID=568818 RepID=A0ABN3CZT6_9ACTN